MSEAKLLKSDISQVQVVSSVVRQGQEGPLVDKIPGQAVRKYLDCKFAPIPWSISPEFSTKPGAVFPRPSIFSNQR